jgi:colicin import membrane protein
MSTLNLPRTVVTTYLNVARLPLSAVAKLSGQQGNEQWPPALAFEGFEASVETVVGSLLRDDELVESGRLRQAKVAQLRKAASLEAIADTTREQAREEFAQRRAAAESTKQQARERAQQREQQVERQAEQRKAQAESKAAKKKAAARQVKAAQEKTIERRERVAEQQALATEAEALKAQKEALDTAETVDVIDDTIEGSKAARHTG